MKRLIALFLIFLSTFALANELTNEEASAFGDQTQPKAQSYSNTTFTKNLYLSYLNYPNHVFRNQRFVVEVKALITRKNFNSIQTVFLNGNGIAPSNPKETWKKLETEDNTYTNKFYFKAKNPNFVMPTIEVRLYNGNQLVESRQIMGKNVGFSDIAKSDERFTNVIASQLTLIGTKTKQYNNKEALTIIDINAKNSNLEDFSLKGFEEQGITVFEENLPDQHIIYNVTIPIHKKNIIFNYYNTTKNQFEKIEVPITFDEELVSTQTDLNPNNSSFEFYKKIAMGVLSLVLLVLLIWKRKYYILIPFLISLAIFILFAMPNKTITLKEKTVIYILPTKNSTIFQKVEKESIVEEMKRKNGFIKIMFGSGNYIGWVKEEDVSTN